MYWSRLSKPMFYRLFFISGKCDYSVTEMFPTFEENNKKAASR